ncbi:MAG: stage II sporulation protein D [Clostridia bacterium]|nr:stage II sporulation protein D [Clostridia bacterium]
MKRKRVKTNWAVVVPLAAVLFVLVFVLALMVRTLAKTGYRILDVSLTPQPTASPTPAPTRLDLYTYYNFAETQQIPVFDHRENRLIVMDFEKYIIGVVGAEMPTTYAPEALKAQAVAARTYALRKILRGRCASHPEAAICTDSKCCQAYISDERMNERWGDAAGMKYNLLAEAVMSTAGEVLCYNGEVIDAMFHACSGGMTENSENVYSNALPYLRGVESPYEDPMRTQTVTVTFAEAVERINAVYPEAGVTEETIGDAIEILAVYPSGRVKTVRLGRIEIVGKKLRTVFDLESAMYTMEKTETGFVFSVKGYGHGVGMSQNGANGMAQRGATYEEILKHYYTGVTIEPNLNQANLSDPNGGQ